MFVSRDGPGPDAYPDDAARSVDRAAAFAWVRVGPTQGSFTELLDGSGSERLPLGGGNRLRRGL